MAAPGIESVTLTKGSNYLAIHQKALYQGFPERQSALFPVSLCYESSNRFIWRILNVIFHSHVLESSDYTVLLSVVKEALESAICAVVQIPLVDRFFSMDFWVKVLTCWKKHISLPYRAPPYARNTINIFSDIHIFAVCYFRDSEL